MEHAVTRTRARGIAGPLRWVDLRALSAWALGALLVVYLGMRGGGYDPLVRGEVGIAVWWIILMGAAAGVLPLVRLRRSAWLAVGLLVAFAAWTGLGIAWSSSAERSTSELARVATYAGVLVLALAVFNRRTARHGLNGVGTGIALIAGLAVASRMFPSAFPADQVPEFLGVSAKRLNYPLNYSDGLASFLALGLPVLLGIGATARTIAGRALAGGVIPVVVLALFLTDSRGGVLALVAGLVAFYVLVPDRLPKLAAGLAAAAGGAILIAAVSDRADLQNGLVTAAADRQGDELLAFVIVTVLGVALVQAAIALLDRHAQRPAWIVIPRRHAAIGGGVALVAALAIAVAAGAPGALSDQWEDFKQPEASGPVATNVFDRLQNLSGSRRYQYWTVATDAFESQPLRGIGPGTFEFYWLEHGKPYEFVRNAHSLFMETLAELGIVGLLLLLGMLGWLIAATGRAALAPRGDPALRVVAGAACAGIVAFCGGALVNWTWQIGVIPIAMLLLAAVGLAAGRPSPLRLDTPEPRSPLASRVVLGVLAAAALIAIAIPFAATDALRASQADARGNDLSAALERANDAIALQTYAATPRLQRGLILEAAGRNADAAVAVRAAIARESENWRLWLVLSRLEAKAGHAKPSVAAYRKARSLNPGSPILRAP